MSDDLIPLELDDLDVQALPRGRRVAAWLPILEDGLGNMIRLPLLVARGKHPGPVVGLTAAVHGDELNGIPAIHRLFASLEVERLRGTLVAVVVANPLAFHRRTRRLEDAFDLNHLFPGKKRGHVGEVLAHRLRNRVLKQLDVLVDLHTASRGRVNCLYVRADMTHGPTARLAYLQRPQIIVHNRPSDGSFRGAAASLGLPAITVEIGDPSRFQTRYTRRATAGLRAVLADLGMVPKRPVNLGDPPIVCGRSEWIFTDRGGLLDVHVDVVDEVKAGDRLATLTDVFGTPRATFDAPYDGVVVGHAVDPVAPTGARIVHLGQPVGPDDGCLSRDDAMASPWGLEDLP